MPTDTIISIVEQGEVHIVRVEPPIEGAELPPFLAFTGAIVNLEYDQKPDATEVTVRSGDVRAMAVAESIAYSLRNTREGTIYSPLGDMR